MRFTLLYRNIVKRYLYFTLTVALQSFTSITLYMYETLQDNVKMHKVWSRALRNFTLFLKVLQICYFVLWNLFSCNVTPSTTWPKWTLKVKQSTSNELNTFTCTNLCKVVKIFVCMKRFAKLKKRLEATHVLCSQLERHDSSIFRVQHSPPHAPVATMLSFWWIESILPKCFRRPSDHDRFSWRTIFDNHRISIDFTGNKNTNKFIV